MRDSIPHYYPSSKSALSHSQADVFVFPASFAQQRLWFFHQLLPDSPLYNVSAAIRLQGQLDQSALEQSLNEIVGRHESLRTTFELIDAELIQVVSPELTLSITLIDLQPLAAEQQQIAARQIVVKTAQLPFDLSRDALLRVTLLKLQETESILLLGLHHIVADAWSIGVLIRELSALYTAFRAGQPSPLPELPLQYADFAHWQRQWLQGAVLETQRSYWRSQLQHLPVLDLPTDYARPALQHYRGKTLPIEFPQSLAIALETLSQQAGVSLFMTLLAAFQTLLSRYTGQTDIVVGTPIANRNRSELEGLIGFFVNSLVLRTDLSGNPSFQDLLHRVKQVTLAAYAHQDLPFEMLVQELQPQRSLSHHPLFQVAIALQNTPIQALELPGLTLELFEFDSGTARLDLEWHLWQSATGLQGQITYNTDLFEATTIQRMLGHFQTLLTAVVLHPDQQIAELPLLTPAEQHQLLITWNQTQQNLDFLPQPVFHRLFEAQVEKTPTAIALVFEDQALSYQALNHRSNQLAHYLQQWGVRPDVLVAVCLDRSIDLIVTVLAILKAGGAYVPLDPTYPQARLAFMLEDAQPALLITQQSLSQQFATCNLPWICLDRVWQTVAQYCRDNPISSTNAANLAYLIYTSGSSGKPKAVLIEQRGLLNLAHAQQQCFQLQPSDRILQFASFSFDASVFEMVMAFQAGATLYLAKQTSLLGNDLLQFLQQQAISVATLPPTGLSSLPPGDLPALHTLIIAGEVGPADLIQRWLTPKRRCFNAYGPTEATVWSTIAEMQTTQTPRTIGRAIANTQLYVLDPHLQPVPIGIAGELYIGGAGVARGYLNRPELTAARFIANPFSKSNPLVLGTDERKTSLSLPTHLYQTGDRVRYLVDGSLEFLGRMDQQVKIRGVRVEPGEIEAVLTQHPAVQAAAVIWSQKASGHPQLIAFVVLQAQASSNREALHHFLQHQLPTYLLPSQISILAALPTTPNGKIDRRALSTLELFQRDRVDAMVAPGNATEAALARLWQTLLKLEQVSINDNFFALGGDSLLAVQLIQQIEQQLQQTLPLTVLFQAPTIAQLAALLNRSDAKAAVALSWSPLVPLKASGSKPPFFCVHPVFGVVFPYWQLAHHLDREQPFYGLQPFGLDGKQPAYTRIEDMATAYINAIRIQQPIGPYQLGGWSFGGLVAFEMARQLQQAGEQVSLLAILDTAAPISDNQVSLWHSLKFLVNTATRSALPLLFDYLSLLLASRSSQLSSSWQSQWQWRAIARLFPDEPRLQLLNEGTIRPMLQVFYANNRAAQDYLPSSYSGKITLFRTAQPFGSGQDATLGWNQLADTVEIHPIPGNHLSMLQSPQVQILAQQLQTCLEQSFT